MSELKPCPRCGPKGEAVSRRKTISSLIVYSVACVRCGMRTLLYSTEAKAVENWNTRPLEDALQAQIDALEAVTQRQRNALYILEHMILANHHMQIECNDDEYFIYTDDGFFDHAEDFIGAVYKAYEAWRVKE